MWKVNTAHIRRFDRLIVETLGYHWVNSDRPALEPLILSAATPKQEIERLLKSVVAIHDYLMDFCQGADSFALVRTLKKHGVASANLDDIPVLIDLCSTAEPTGVDPGVYWLQIQSLRGRADQAVRVLHENGKPLHHTDLLREINQRLPSRKRVESKENLVNQLIPDTRLHPIGKSGKWALTEWGVEARSLVDVVEDVLGSAGEAMSQDEIAEKVLQMRPGAIASIPMILSFNSDRFRRVAPKVYALSAWGDSIGEGILDEDSVAKFVGDYFKTIGEPTTDFKEMRMAFSKTSGLSPRSAAGVLANHPAVVVTMANSYIRLASFRSDWQAILKTRKYQRRAPLQFDLIIEEARKLLTETDSGELPLINVVKSIEKKLMINRVNVYSAISQSQEMEKVAIEGSTFKVLRRRGSTRMQFAQLALIHCKDWQNECERAVSKLTVEEVDIGLFLLGRQFDHAMKQLLQAAKDAGLPVLNGHMERLQGRVDWAFSQGLFLDKPTLNVLRIERNERGHNPPTETERQAAMKYAPFLAGLYLDYLIMIEKHIESFRLLKK